ncbi:GGDEF domain-containing protein [Methylobacterium gregans]|uniref:diguanylate cyclase n=1 Tax=Methylobacterium gregans TaxID=374424 RepID=A0AA37HPF8_9HYPH|nr:GGDEF domain-containing protein [Methylobacterium gregans]MDQ0519334.1 diguanylate cyclase [Methylobacterium gregans]GJD78733.1 Diguanylate cyclase VdcA [Methylobacterium gregans]GLS53027.1 GGDEF domain-containing protein [Methylobacterium gregans]
MNQERHADRDYSFALAQRVQELMRDYGPSATPRAYTVWYSYVAGEHPLMNDAIKRLITQKQTLTETDTDTLFEQHLAGGRLAHMAGETSATMLSEIAGVMEMLDLSVDSAAAYNASLSSISQDLTHNAVTRERVREIVGSVVAKTREVATSNRVLEARMRESRAEIEMLREKLEATRLESLTDPLTGLSNRKHFEEMLRACVDAATQTGTAMSLIVLDIDFFKRFNDLYGHLTGDQVLRLVAIVMRESAGNHATLSRFGGEEFGIVLPGLDRTEARGIAEAVRQNVMGRDLVKRSTGESLGRVSVSVGVAAYKAGDSPVSLLERADLCMFAAKRAGRNRTIDDSVGADALQHVA